MKMTPLFGHQFCDVSAFPRLLDLDLSVVVFCSSTSLPLSFMSFGGPSKVFRFHQYLLSSLTKIIYFLNIRQRELFLVLRGMYIVEAASATMYGVGFANERIREMYQPSILWSFNAAPNTPYTERQAEINRPRQPRLYSD